MRSGFCFCTIFMVAVSVSAFAYDWATNPGDGSPQNPYQISEPNHLIAIGSNADLLDKHFILTNDIIFDPNNNPAHVFDNALIGQDTDNSDWYFYDTKFSGVFDGQNHGIYNFKCIDPTGYYIGLFGYTDSASYIFNLHLYDVILQGRIYVGGLVGLNYGIVENCSVTGTVAGQEMTGGVVGMNEEGSILKDSHCDITILDPLGDTYETGGLVGYNYEGDVINCYSSGLVDGGIESCMVGGLAGFNRGRIRKCYSTADVNGGWYVGGLIGEHDWYELVACYATGDVFGEDGIGGLLGRNYNNVSYCYATGNVEGTGYSAGGLIAESWWGTIVRYCYSAGNVTGVYDIGGLIGIGDERNQEIASFWDTDTSGQTVSYGGIGLSTGDLQNEQILISYGWDFVGETANGYNDDWGMPAETGYPVLWWQMSPLPPLPIFSGGLGTDEDPYLIADANDLRGIGHNLRLMDKHFKMVNDIDLDGVTYFPIADSGYPFTGRLDGNYHTISNLHFSTDYIIRVGLVAYLGEGGQIRNLGLTGVKIDVSGDNYCTGGLVGYNQKGLIHNSFVSGFIQGNSDVGLLIGNNEEGTISNCYVTGQASGGGLIGDNFYGNIANCYAAVEIFPGGTGVLIGLSSNSTYNNCFWHKELNERVQAYSSYAIIPGISGLSDSAMQSESSFTSAGWDFVGESDNGNEDIWTMPSYGYPVFTWQSETVIPNVSGIVLEEAVDILSSVNLNSWNTVRAYDSNVPAGSVIYTIPQNGIQVAECFPVCLIVSAGSCPYSGGGMGTKQEPCGISSVADLNTLGQTSEDYDMHFVLTNNIDLTGLTYDKALIAPYTYIANSFQGTPFTGTFDGKGHSINGLNVSAAVNGGYLGLFGQIGCNGVVTNLNLSNVTISGSSSYVGTMAGYNVGIIKNCSISGSVSGKGYTGGLVGFNMNGILQNIKVTASINSTSWYVGGLTAYNSGIISQCGVSGSITGGSYVGGLFGQGAGITSNSYARGTITYTTYPAGGLVGSGNATLTNCFAACTTGAGLVGTGSNGIYTACFWNKTINPTVGLGGGVPQPAGMIGITTTQMKTKSTFTNRNWDFVAETAKGHNDFWRMCVDGVDYPRLSWEFAQNGDFACGDGVDVADLEAMAEHWLLTEAANPTTFNYACDGNGDAQINMSDLGVLAENW